MSRFAEKENSTPDPDFKKHMANLGLADERTSGMSDWAVKLKKHAEIMREICNCPHCK